MRYNRAVANEDPSGAEKSGIHSRVKEAIALTRQEDYETAIEIFEDHLSNLSGGDLSDKRMAAAAFSYYGLCVAMVRHRYAEAVKFCEISLRTNFLDPDHRYNLAMVYLERNDRKKAVETLNAGLRLAPNNTKINVVFNTIGRRKRPPIAFLSRDNPLNIWLGKMRHDSRRSGPPAKRKK
jgi:tetratricopeptide (TPR) repeat protein